MRGRGSATVSCKKYSRCFSAAVVLFYRRVQPKYATGLAWYIYGNASSLETKEVAQPTIAQPPWTASKERVLLLLVY